MNHVINDMGREGFGLAFGAFLVSRAFLFFENGGDRHSTGYERYVTACGGYQFPP